MQLLSHLNSSDQQHLSVFTDESPFQFLPEFTEFNKDYFKSDLAIFYSRELDAYIPARIFGNSLIRFVQIQHSPIRNNKELSANEQLVFFDELITYCREKKIGQRFIQPHPYAILSAYPHNSKHCQFGTYLIDLKNQTEEEMFNKLKKNYAPQIKQAINHGVVCKFGREVLKDFYLCYKTTMQNAGKSYDDFNYFEFLYKHFGEKHITTGVVYENNSPEAGIFVIHTRYAALYTHGGSMGESKLKGCMKLLIWECMKMLKNKGVAKFDFVGVRINSSDSSLQGIFNFKRGFGGDLKEGYLWKMDLSPIKTSVYDWLLKIKNPGASLKDIIDQENN